MSGDATDSVYALLLRHFAADKSAARLLRAMEELAGRLEAAEDAAGLRTQQHHDSSGGRLSNLPLPDPARGPLPLLPGGACEHAALQEAAQHSSRSLRSTAERRSWRSWVMAPQHAAHVVEAAWLLVALVFRQDDVCAAALQAHVCLQIQRHHVSEVLAGQQPQLEACCSQLWTDTLADAACRLLRAAYPAVPELQDTQLQQLLQRQLRLYTTGLLPSDAAAPVLRAAKQQQQPGHRITGQRSDTSVTADAAAAASGQLEVLLQPPADTPRRHTAQFLSAKPGPAVSALMAAQGMQPAPDLLQAHAGELTRITLPSGLLHQQARAQLCADQAAATAAVGGSSSATQQQQQQQHGVLGGCAQAALASLSDCSGSQHRAKAAACVAAASGAVAAYEQRKAASAASVRAGSLSAQVAVQALQRQRAKAIRAGPSTAKETSNRVSGWLTEAGAATVCMPVKQAAKGEGSSSSSSSSKLERTRGKQQNSGSSRSSRPLATDTQCKSQRHVLEGQLRAGDWRMARAFNASLHDTATNMAAAVATLPPAPITPMPPTGAAAAAGQDWGALVTSSVARSRVMGAAGSAAVRSAAHGSSSSSSSSSSNIKTKKEARAIVEGMQRAFAASSSAPFGAARR